MVDSVFMAELSWPEFQAKAAANTPVFLPVGGTGTTRTAFAAVAPMRSCRPRSPKGWRVPEQAGLGTPALAYGYKSQPKCGGGQHFPGTTSLDAKTLAQIVRDIVREFGRHGVRASSSSTATTRTPGRRSRASTSACASSAATGSPTCRCCVSSTGTSSSG